MAEGSVCLHALGRSYHEQPLLVPSCVRWMRGSPACLGPELNRPRCLASSPLDASSRLEKTSRWWF